VPANGVITGLFEGLCESLPDLIFLAELLALSKYSRTSPFPNNHLLRGLIRVGSTNDAICPALAEVEQHTHEDCPFVTPGLLVFTVPSIRIARRFVKYLYYLIY